MAWQLQRAGASFTLQLLARDRVHAPFLDELQARHGLRVRAYLSQGAPAQRLDIAATLAAIRTGAAAAGWDEARVHVESFVPLADDGAPRHAFEVRLQRSGRVLTVGAAQSTLEALREAGCVVPSSCGIGVCGTCECTVLDGEVLHRDVVLDGAARRRAMLPCVSRGRGRLTLDL